MQLDGLKSPFKIDPEISGLFKGLSSWDYEALKNEIANSGIRVPIEVASDGTVIDGHQRLKAWHELGRNLSEIPVRRMTYTSRTEMIAAAVRYNVIRRHLNYAQRAWVACKHFLPEERSKARERQATGTGVSNQQLPEICQEGEGEAFDIAAKRVGLSGRTLRRAEKVFNQAPSELVELVLKGKVSINKAHQKVQAKERLLEQASQPVLESFEKGKVNLNKSLMISDLPKEDQPAVVRKVIDENPSKEQTEWLVTTILEKPEKKDEILAQPITHLTPPPREVQEFEVKYGSDRSKFEKVECPHCGQGLIVNWPLGRITKAVKEK